MYWGKDSLSARIDNGQKKEASICQVRYLTGTYHTVVGIYIVTQGRLGKVGIYIIVRQGSAVLNRILPSDK